MRFQQTFFQAIARGLAVGKIERTARAGKKRAEYALCKSQDRIVKRRRKGGMVFLPSYSYARNFHKFASCINEPPFFLAVRPVFVPVLREPLSKREAAIDWWTLGLKAHSLACLSFAHPYPVVHGHIARTYGTHVMYVPSWTHVARADIRTCSPDAMCTGWKKSALCYENGELRYRALVFPCRHVATFIPAICITLDAY